MKNDPEHDRLLDDVLAELAPPDFRADLLDRTLRQVRRKHRRRQWNRGVLAVAGVAAIGFLLVRDHARRASDHETSAATSLRMITSQPLDSSMLVESVPGSVPMIVSTSSTISMISTDPATRNYRELTDDELLALMPGQPAVLVRQGPHHAELLLVDSGARVFSPGQGSDQ